MSTLLIRNGTIVTDSKAFPSDVYIIDERIHTVGENLKVNADTVLDATGCLVIPGGIDAHTHMELPVMGTRSSDSFETGTQAALHGGTTTIIDFATQDRSGGLVTALDERLKGAEGNAACDYGFHVAVTDFNKSAQREIKDLIEKRGVSSFKVYMAYKGTVMLKDGQILELMKEVRKYGGIVGAHAENGEKIECLIQKHLREGNTSPRFHALCRPEEMEEEATQRYIELAQKSCCSAYIVHMSCEGAIKRVREASRKNVPVSVETCIQYLLLDDRLYQDESEAPKWVMSPPLRKPKDQQALWTAITEGLVQTVATDHCPFRVGQKKRGENDFSKIPNGVPGVEHRMELLFSEGVTKNRISASKFVDLVSTAPAKLFGLYPRKGTIAAGSDGDIVIFDPKRSHTISASSHHMKCDYSAFEAWKVTGKCRTTVLRGNVVVDDGRMLAGKGFGRYLRREGSMNAV